MVLTACTGRGTRSSVTSRARALAAAGFGRQEGDCAASNPPLHGVGVGDPEHMGDAGILARVDDEPPEELLDIVEELVRAEAGIRWPWPSLVVSFRYRRKKPIVGGNRRGKSPPTSRRPLA